ncbi:UPF0280 family protein [Sediminispirochaeta smaragdinae]|uniref:ApbE family lipoprotein n=1 Tax=Sediminispirochaeta smaragdinae (strain DSM 11293 / JCM 15392 / SEBR 4228) TaxID=573413 RepID=E1R412_SEDSS|nr:UPF0280 family protein [Sediminispirochaeta smaragdinae]ADK80434.1 ApbE family lipoprotein [Sediminispirochaeta smaragdinae DSM 11293]
MAPVLRSSKRNFRALSFRGAHYRISDKAFDSARRYLPVLRKELEKYIRHFPDFQRALTPLTVLQTPAPESAIRMHKASLRIGVGPMAAVAGTFAQLAVEKALSEGLEEAIVENGGDVFMKLEHELILALYAGKAPEGFRHLAFRIEAEQTPLAVCSSSSKMGHSLSFGRADLVTVVAPDAAIADAAATWGANGIDSPKELGRRAEEIADLPGVQGVLIILDGTMAMAGKLPPLIRHVDPRLKSRVSKDKESNFPG